MSQEPRPSVIRELSHRIGKLAINELEAYHMLTDEQPAIELGTLVIPKSVHNQVPHRCLWFAIKMHERGYWGRVSDVDFQRNDEARQQGGALVSFWTFQDVRAFWLRTTTEHDGIATTAFLDCVAAST